MPAWPAIDEVQKYRATAPNPPSPSNFKAVCDTLISERNAVRISATIRSEWGNLSGLLRTGSVVVNSDMSFDPKVIQTASLDACASRCREALDEISTLPAESDLNCPKFVQLVQITDDLLSVRKLMKKESLEEACELLQRVRERHSSQLPLKTAVADIALQELSLYNQIIVNKKAITTLDKELREGKVTGVVGNVDTRDLRVDGLEAGLRWVETNRISFPLQTEHLIRRAHITAQVRASLLGGGWGAAASLVLDTPAFFADLKDHLENDAGSEELTLLWKEAMDWNTRSELTAGLGSSANASSTNEELVYCLKCAVMKAERSGYHSQYSPIYDTPQR